MNTDCTDVEFRNPCNPCVDLLHLFAVKQLFRLERRPYLFAFFPAFLPSFFAPFLAALAFCSPG